MTPYVRLSQCATVRFACGDQFFENGFIVVGIAPPWLDLECDGAGVVPLLDTLVDLDIGGSQARATVQRRWANGFSVLRPIYFEAHTDDAAERLPEGAIEDAVQAHRSKQIEYWVGRARAERIEPES